MKTGAKLIVLAVTVAFVAILGEVGFRVVDGYRLTSLRLSPVTVVEAPRAPVTEWPTAGADAIAEPHVNAIPIPTSVDRAWFFTDPPPPPAKPARPDLEALSTGIADQTQAKFARRIWNVNFVVGQAKRRQSYWEYLKPIQTPLMVFDPPDHSEHPRYRLIPNDPHAEAWPTGTMVTNNLGYRGRDVSVVKPAGTVRVVFVGASTTIDHPSFRLSFTDYVGHYLNQWAKARRLDVQFEVVNAAREGFQSTDLAAVVEQEALALSPDIVVYKEGANQFGAAKRLLTVADSTVKPITPDFISQGVISGTPANYRLDLRRRWDLIAASVRPIGEAPRPPYTVNWPPGVSEQAPDLSRPDLPLDLPVILKDLRQIHASVRLVGADLALSSALWLADDQLRLVPGRANERGIYWYLNGNEVLWPLKYRDIRRFADFQNRVFQAFCEADGVHFVDLARRFPPDPALYTDAVHISYPGLKLHGWITFLELLPLVERRLNQKAVTIAPAETAPVTFETVTIAQVVQRLAAGAVPLPVPALEQWKPGSAVVRLTLDQSRLRVEGTATRWAYQLVSADIPVTPNTQYVVSVPTSVTSGAIGIGVLDQSGGTWISSPLDATPFTFSSGPNTKVQLVIADATPTMAPVRASTFEVRRDRE